MLGYRVRVSKVSCYDNTEGVAKTDKPNPSSRPAGLPIPCAGTYALYIHIGLFISRYFSFFTIDLFKNKTSIKCRFAVMAIFGPQLVTTMIIASVVHKLLRYYSIGQWFISSGLVRFLLPTDADLRPHVFGGSYGNASKTTGRARQNHASHSFIPSDAQIKNSSEIKLKSTPITASDLSAVRFFTELKWTLDLLAAVLLVFVVTCAYFWIRPTASLSEVNLSAAWIGFLLFYIIKLLFTLNKVYFSDELAEERNSQLVISAGLFVCLLGIMVIDEQFLDFGLEETRVKFVGTLHVMATNISQDLAVSETVFPVWGFKMSLAIVACALGAICIFPWINYSRVHFETRISSRSVLFKSLLHVNFILPAVLATLWLKPALSRSASSNSVLKPENMALVRSTSLLGFCFLRVLLFRPHMQVYLNRAQQCLMVLRAEKGKVTVASFYNKFTSLFSFYCCAALQYLGPVIILLLLDLLMVISSDYHNLFPGVQPGDVVLRPTVFDLGLYHGIFSFLCWWMCVSMFLVSGIGSLLYSML